MRPRALPAPSLKFWRSIFRAALLAVMFWGGVAWALSSCSPRAFQDVNKQAVEPPYVGQYHSGLDRAQYLRDMEPLKND